MDFKVIVGDLPVYHSAICPHCKGDAVALSAVGPSNDDPKATAESIDNRVIWGECGVVSIHGRTVWNFNRFNYVGGC